jgi:hypothetical protein
MPSSFFRDPDRKIPYLYCVAADMYKFQPGALIIAVPIPSGTKPDGKSGYRPPKSEKH